MSKQMKSTGVTAHANSFSSSEVEESVDFNVLNAGEADESSVAFENEKIPKMSIHPSDTSNVDYYAMKTKKNPQFKNPCKIEFQRLNYNLKQKMSRQPVACHSEYHPCNCQNYMPNPNYMTNSNYSHMNAMNSQMNNHQHYAQNVSDMTLEDCDKHKPDGGKISKMFSCFTANSIDQNSSENGDEVKVDPQHSDAKSQKTEYYPFEHGDHKYYNTTDKAPQLVSDNAAEKVHEHATKFWAEVFGTLNIGVTFFLVFFIQFYRFILYSFIRSIVVGILQTTSDYFIKPILAMIFNGIIQPVLLFVRNILESTWDTLEPLAHMILGFCLPIIECIRSFRLFDMNTGRGNRKQRNEICIV